MSSAFPGYPAAGLEFLAQLARHNRKDWFEAHRDTYERCLKAPTVELVTALNGSLARFAPAYSSFFSAPSSRLRWRRRRSS